MDLTGSTQVRVPVTRHNVTVRGIRKYEMVTTALRSYVVVGSLRDATNFGYLDVHRSMASYYIKVVISISQNNNITTVSSTLFIPYLRKSYKTLLLQIEKPQ